MTAYRTELLGDCGDVEPVVTTLFSASEQPPKGCTFDAPHRGACERTGGVRCLDGDCAITRVFTLAYVDDDTWEGVEQLDIGCSGTRFRCSSRYKLVLQRD